MEEELIKLETAKLAKEKGFDELVTSVYWWDVDYLTLKLSKNAMPFRNSLNLDTYSAPTQSLLQKWLREKHKIHVTVTSISQESWQYHITKVGESLGTLYAGDYYTFEEALEDGLQEVLKLIK